MIVDAGRREITPRTFWDTISSSSLETKFVEGYELHSLSIDRSALASAGPNKQSFDTNFQKSFQEIGFFDHVSVIPQDAFEKIIRSGERKRWAADKERLHQLQLELAALEKRYEDGAIDDGKFTRKQREIEDEQLDIYAARNSRAPIFTNPAGLHNVQEHYGDHLLARILVNKTSWASLKVDLRILDPVTRDIVFRAHNSMDGWDRERSPPFGACVFYPLFNAFIDWVETNSDIRR